MNELGVQPHVVEKSVNHISGHLAGVAGVYNKAELLPERREALERWRRFVALVIDRDLYAAHETFLANDDEKVRNKRREAFNAAIAEDGERWVEDTSRRSRPAAMATSCRCIRRVRHERGLRSFSQSL